ncbi:MAG TPA: sigma-54-dependent Fis family transcriptional regulator [Bacteroidales bacterium]|nr:sigma-54-dependent Fis family transcriptional regulator [Bacteroidales bacterium]
MDVLHIKQRFSIIGNSPLLNRAIDIAIQVAQTDLSVFVTGESGTGKEIVPQIIHQNSARKHNKYIAVNCGAIPEGTINSELFGHEKGSFTGAVEKRKGYFEEANNGTIFLDEVAELPLETQVRLLRILETGEFLKVGSSVVQKTNVRIIAATNIDVQEAIKNGKFREDLFYRLNTVPIYLPPLRERREDIPLLFRKFSGDFAEKYNMPPIRLTDDAIKVLINYRWPGNIRQLKNVTEQVSIIEEKRLIDAETLKKYLPEYFESKLPAIYKSGIDEKTFSTEREILYKILFDMKKDIDEMKKTIASITSNNYSSANVPEEDIIKLDKKIELTVPEKKSHFTVESPKVEDTTEYIEESLSIVDKEKELIIKALEKHNGKRKYAAQELGISERTLYRKLKEYKIEI